LKRRIFPRLHAGDDFAVLITDITELVVTSGKLFSMVVLTHLKKTTSEVSRRFIGAVDEETVAA
jgi:hypothetical protein